jgi:hypothetical protein
MDNLLIQHFIYISFCIKKIIILGQVYRFNTLQKFTSQVIRMFHFYLLNYIDCNLNRLDIGFIKFLFLFYLYLHFCISTVTYKDIEQNVLFKWADHKYVNERKDK